MSDKRRGTALAIADIGSAAGVAAISLAIPFLVNAFNWQAGWKSLGILALLTAVVNYILVRNRPESNSDKEWARSQEASTRPIKI